LLNSDGLLFLKFQVNTPWIAGRLHLLLSIAFGRSPVDFYANASKYSTGGNFFVAGSEKRLNEAMAVPDLGLYVKSHSGIKMQEARATTDDWPGLPLIVIILSVLLVVITRVLMVQTGTVGRSIHWHFFFLGAGFLLLETQIVSRMALLFGTTWFVNAIVIAAILVLILVGNLVAHFRPTITHRLLYLGIAISILVSYFTPLGNLFCSRSG